MASAVLNTISKDWVERSRLISEEKHELDVQTKVAHARNETAKEWKIVVAEKDATITNYAAEIARLRAELEKKSGNK